MSAAADNRDWPLTLVNAATGARLEIPGFYEGGNAARGLRTDEAATEGKSGKRRQAQGFEDAEVTLTRLLIDDEQSTALEKLAKIEQFRAALDSTGKPPTFKIISPHPNARGVRQVLWTDLRSYETNRDMTVGVDLVFVEYDPSVALAEDRAAPPANSAAANPEISAEFGLEDTVPTYYYEGW